MRNILLLLACLAVAPVVSGCHRSGEICDLVCDCENCSNTEYDECIIKYDANEDIASTYGCIDQYDRAQDCVVNNHDCVADNFGPQLECLDDIADIGKCIDSNSSL
jgi:hypothetical protein